MTLNSFRYSTSRIYIENLHFLKKTILTKAVSCSVVWPFFLEGFSKNAHLIDLHTERKIFFTLRYKNSSPKFGFDRLSIKYPSGSVQMQIMFFFSGNQYLFKHICYLEHVLK